MAGAAFNIVVKPCFLPRIICTLTLRISVFSRTSGSMLAVAGAASSIVLKPRFLPRYKLLNYVKHELIPFTIL